MLRERSYVRYGFTLVELLVVIAIIGILIALSLLPAVQAARGRSAARSVPTILSNLGWHSICIHDTYQVFPAMSAGTQSGSVNNGGALSGLVAMLPYLDQKPCMMLSLRVIPPMVFRLGVGTLRICNGLCGWCLHRWFVALRMMGSGTEERRGSIITLFPRRRLSKHE